MSDLLAGVLVPRGIPLRRMGLNIRFHQSKIICSGHVRLDKSVKLPLEYLVLSRAQLL
jgi:hypothetical protein